MSFVGEKISQTKQLNIKKAMNLNEAGKYLIIIGIIIVILGIIIYFLGNKFSWFGNLPGDIKIEKENVRIYFPFISMLIISVVISFIIYIFRKFF